MKGTNSNINFQLPLYVEKGKMFSKKYYRPRKVPTLLSIELVLLIPDVGNQVIDIFVSSKE